MPHLTRIREGVPCDAFCSCSPAVECLVAQVAAQSSLPAPEQTLIIAVRSSRQATTQSPYELTLASGARITVPLKDVHDAATAHVRRLVGTQVTSLDAALVFVLQVQSSTPVGTSHVNVALHSGTVVRVATKDIEDLRLTFLRTALAEATARERQLADPHHADRVKNGYLSTIMMTIRPNWQRSQGVAGKVIIKFVIQRDGRITDIEVKETGGEVLDRASMRALVVTGRVPPLPREFPDNTLNVELVFEYQR